MRLCERRKEVVRLIDRLRVGRPWGTVLSIALAIALLPMVASAADPCTKLPDLWLPADGTVGLADGGISVQTTTGDVCQGDDVIITVTIDNLSCGDAGPFDVTVYYDDTGHVIGTQHLAGLPGCEFTTLTFVWDTTTAPTGDHEILACVDACRTNPFEVVTPALADELGNISTLVAVLLDWDQPREGLLRAAAEAGCAVKAVIVRDRDTAEPYDHAADEYGIVQCSPADVARGGVELL